MSRLSRHPVSVSSSSIAVSKAVGLADQSTIRFISSDGSRSLFDKMWTCGMKKRCARACYAESKNYNLDVLGDLANLIFVQIDTDRKEWDSFPRLIIEEFCNTVNDIQFNFTKRDIKINIPTIDLSLFRSRNIH